MSHWYGWIKRCVWRLTVPGRHAHKVKIGLSFELLDHPTRSNGRAAGHPVPALFDGDGNSHLSIVVAPYQSGTDPRSCPSVRAITSFWSGRAFWSQLGRAAKT